MSQLIIPLHPETPEQRLLHTIAELLRNGCLLLYPSDTSMALGCALRNPTGIDRIRRIRQVEDTKSMTFLCSSLKNLSEYAHVSNPAYRIIKRLVPGPYTFILPATKAVPRYAHDPKRKTVGIRIPRAPIPRSIVEAFGEPLISITAKSQRGEELFSPEQAVEELGAYVDCAITVQHFSWFEHPMFEGPSTVIDLTNDIPTIIRKGAGHEQVEELFHTSSHNY